MSPRGPAGLIVGVETLELLSQERPEIHTRRAPPGWRGIARQALFFQGEGRLVADRLAGEGAQRPAVQVVAGVLEDALRIDAPPRLAGLDRGAGHRGGDLRRAPEVEG